ncbi:hypothetical protein [Desulfosporosinus sp. FKA]|uniref:hypothetical protein n=1 Tax=Desulfosporosinus sp. FKA TaxID=1969834 RepID=UPI000B497F71|nr:hypothetical protein [Desulfosporosinus sp. FKA]
MLNFILTSNVLVTLETVLGLILADFIFGVLLSLRNSSFSFSKLPQFVETSLVPYIGGLLVLAVFSNVNAELGTLFFTIAATISAKFLADIVTKAGQLFNGLQIQSPVTVAKPDSKVGTDSVKQETTANSTSSEVTQ